MFRKSRSLFVGLSALMLCVGVTPWAILHRSELESWLDESGTRAGYAVQNVVESVRQELRRIQRASRDASRDQAQAPRRSGTPSLPGESDERDQTGFSSLAA